MAETKVKTGKKHWVHRGIHHGHKMMAIIGFFTSILMVVMLAYVAAYRGMIVAGVKIVGMEVGNMNAETAAKLVEYKIRTEGLSPLVVESGDQKWGINPGEVDASVNVHKTVGRAWLVGREGGLLERFSQAQESYFKGRNFDLVVEVDENKLDEKIRAIQNSLDEDEIQPSLTIENKEVVLVAGKDGYKVDGDLLKEKIVGTWSELRNEAIEVPANEVKVGARDEEIQRSIALAKSLLGKKLTVIIDEERWTLGEEEIIGMISPTLGGVDQDKVIEEMEDFVASVNREPQNAAFKFVDGKVQEFRPGKDGLKVIEDKFAEEVSKGVVSLASKEELSIGVPVLRTAPAVSTAQVNNLGIKELLGTGESTYFHSIPNRVHNVALAAGRIDGVLIPPGETFSFNQTLGDVSASTGFRSAYVISGGRTILGDGGGVCQVSTTLFRAALASGLPIVERKAHAYRVGYYEQDSPPGIDATVYNPTADFKFKNDTPSYLLVQTEVDPKNYYLKFEIYGTSDGRVVSLSKPKLWGQVGAPPTLYQDDPTLPVGTVKQIDWAAAGAKTSFDYQVLNADGSVRYEETFYSNYRPWQAIFLRGTAVQ